MSIEIRSLTFSRGPDGVSTVAHVMVKSGAATQMVSYPVSDAQRLMHIETLARFAWEDAIAEAGDDCENPVTAEEMERWLNSTG